MSKNTGIKSVRQPISTVMCAMHPKEAALAFEECNFARDYRRLNSDRYAAFAYRGKQKIK